MNYPNMDMDASFELMWEELGPFLGDDRKETVKIGYQSGWAAHNMLMAGVTMQAGKHVLN